MACEACSLYSELQVIKDGLRDAFSGKIIRNKVEYETKSGE